MAQARQTDVTLARVWQRCGEDPADSVAWEELFRCLLPVLSAMVARTVQQLRVHEKADIDDLLQDVSFKIWELRRTKRRLPAEDASLRTYFRKMAANTALTWIRGRRTRKRDVLASVSLDDRLPLLAEQIGLQRVERKILMREVDTYLNCSRRDRAIFWLYFRQGFTAAEIAAMPSVGLSVEGVESLIHRLIVNLRERMRKPQ